MELTLTTEKVAVFNDWLKRFESATLDPRHIGIYTGIRYGLEKLGIYQKVTVQHNEGIFFVTRGTLNDLFERIEQNKIHALWNIGHASGIAWVLNKFDLYELPNG